MNKSGAIFWSIFVCGLLVRLAIAAFLQGAGVANNDVTNYRKVAEILLGGGQLYVDTPGIYPYPPPWSLVEMASFWLSQHVAGIFTFWVKLVPILADMGIVGLLYLFNRSNPRRAILVSGLYAFNPLPILISAVHGQFDSLPIFFSLLGIYLLYRSTTRPLYFSALALMAAIAIKVFPVLLLPVFLFHLKTWRVRFLFSVVALFPVLLLMVPYLLQNFVAVNRELIGYSGVLDLGWGAFIRIGAMFVSPDLWSPATIRVLQLIGKILFLVSYLGILYTAFRSENREHSTPIQQSAVIFVLFYVFYTGISSQYLVWVLPFLLMLQSRSAMHYSLVATFAVVASYICLNPTMFLPSYTLILNASLSILLWLLGALVWWFWLIIWLVLRVRWLYNERRLSLPLPSR